MTKKGTLILHQRKSLPISRRSKPNKAKMTITKMAKARGIQRGEVTHHQFQSIMLLILRAKKSKNKRRLNGGTKSILIVFSFVITILI
jgi:hypothetical protein